MDALWVRGMRIMLDERRTRRMAGRFAALLILCSWLLPGTLYAQTLDRIRQDNTIRIAYRAAMRRHFPITAAMTNRPASWSICAVL